MPRIRTEAEKAARQAELKAKQQAVQHAPNLSNGVAPAEVLPAIQQQRDVGGRFTKGHTLRSGGRPRDEFAAMSRHYVDRYKLLEIAASMAAGYGRFTKIDHATRLKAIEFVVARGFGQAPAVVELEVYRQTLMVKRIIGVPDADI